MLAPFPGTTSRDPIGDHEFFERFITEKWKGDEAAKQDEIEKFRISHMVSLYLFLFNNSLNGADYKGLFMFDQFIKEANKRRGTGHTADSGQHCWAACMLGPVALPVAGLANLAELLVPSSDQIKDMEQNNRGGLCGTAMIAVGPLAVVFSDKFCDCCCGTNDKTKNP